MERLSQAPWRASWDHILKAERRGHGLVDSRTATAVGGTGVAFDWGKARETIFNDQGRTRLVVAGGLSPANVEQAITTLRPWGVDVVSGVEAAPGRKDPTKVREFVTRARAAHGRMVGISS